MIIVVENCRIEYWTAIESKKHNQHLLLLFFSSKVYLITDGVNKVKETRLSFLPKMSESMKPKSFTSFKLSANSNFLWY